MLIDREDGPVPPPLRSGSPSAAAESFSVLSDVTDIDPGSCEKETARGRLGYVANTGAVFDLAFHMVLGLSSSGQWRVVEVDFVQHEIVR